MSLIQPRIALQSYISHFLSHRKVIYIKIGQNLTMKSLVSSDLAWYAWFKNCTGFYECGGVTFSPCLF